MSIHVDDVFMTVRTETLERTKEMIKLNVNIKESRKVNMLLRVYYKWVDGNKVPYAKITTEKDTKKLVYVYKKFTEGDIMVQKTPGAPVTTICKINLKYTTYIYKYRSLVQIMWYTTKV